MLQNIPEDQSDCEQTEEERRILQLDSDSEESDYNAVRQESDFSSDDDACTHSDSDGRAFILYKRRHANNPLYPAPIDVSHQKSANTRKIAAMSKEETKAASGLALVCNASGSIPFY
ncbi:hypothetical protein EVAR_17013_1 [Eumeta japonica]|uniref:Uncharacterized protein n=1 Tax=Eumeta variegata TaxID=151549 RepID=A0A4C1TWN9_EUMVA|nr:hypothetical protein EVAR_17013_1 [Eumeta japonica]